MRTFRRERAASAQSETGSVGKLIRGISLRFNNFANASRDLFHPHGDAHQTVFDLDMKERFEMYAQVNKMKARNQEQREKREKDLRSPKRAWSERLPRTAQTAWFRGSLSF